MPRKKILFRWGLLLISIYVVLVAILWAFQEEILFHPRPITDPEWTEIIERLQGDYVSILADDGAVLEGIFLTEKSNNDARNPRPTVIVFPGNAMLVADIIDFFTVLPPQGINVLLMDYRGYGLSTGLPHLGWMQHDAEKIFDAAASHPQVDPERIAVLGISLGTGIATHTAATRPVQKIILVSPFTSITDQAFRMFPLIPKPLIRLLLRHPLSIINLAADRTQPALILHGTNDAEIPIRDGETIAKKWGGSASFVSLKGRGHHDMLVDPLLWKEVIEFLQK